jgi:hypothetical protein
LVVGGCLWFGICEVLLGEWFVVGRWLFVVSYVRFVVCRLLFVEYYLRLVVWLLVAGCWLVVRFCGWFCLFWDRGRDIPPPSAYPRNYLK